MSDLRRFEDVRTATSVKQRRSDVYATSKETIFSYFVLSEIFRKFYVILFRLVLGMTFSKLLRFFNFFMREVPINGLVSRVNQT